MFEQLGELVARARRPGDAARRPAVHADQGRRDALGRRYAELGPIVDDVPGVAAAGRRRPGDRPASSPPRTPSFAAEAADLHGTAGRARRRADRVCWCRATRTTTSDVILEVKAGEGGEESALFAGDLLRMYLRYAERHGWKTEVLDATGVDLGGYKDVTRRGEGPAARPAGRGVWARLKYEGGVHRVQRVPVTESQGRIHTSARRRARAARGRGRRRHDRPERPADRRLPLLRARRAERQHHRLRGTHHPPARPASSSPARTRRASCRTRSRRCASCGPGCSPRRRRTADAGRIGAAAQPGRAPSTAVERVRTYNYPENRISDHRVGYKAYNLDQVLDGDLDAVISALIDADRSESGSGGWRLSRAAACCSTRSRRPRPGWLRPGWPPRAPTPSSSPRTCTASRRGELHRVPDSGLRPAVLGRDRPPRGAGAAAAHHRARRTSGTSSSRSVPGCSCPGRRPRSWPAGPSTGCARWT